MRGHSYLPADRVFGRVEKELRRNDRIVLPSEYCEIYKKFGDVFELDKDWKVYDLKDLLTVFNKIDRIGEQKIITLKKVKNRKYKNQVTLCSQILYRNSDPSKKPKTFLKKGTSLANKELKPLTEKHNISADKGKSVNKLLIAAFGKEWITVEKLQWYYEALISDFQTSDEAKHAQEDQADNCNCLDEEPEVKT